MKKVHIILLVLIAGSIAVLISFLKASTTYDSIDSAKAKAGKYVHVIARLDRSQPIEYDALKDPNYLSFTAVDSLGKTVKVIYRNAKPDNLESSEHLVLKGDYENDHFECKEIMMKCPSKYKDDMNAAEKNIRETTQAEPIENQTAEKRTN